MSNKRHLIEEVALEMRAFQAAVDAFDAAAADRLGINRTDLRCLDLLGQRGPMTAGELAEASELTTGAITRLLDRLEQAGYAQRVRDTADRRRVLVELTPLAQQRAGELYGPIGEAGQSELRRYTTGELALLRDFLRRGRALYEQRIRGIKHDPDG